MTPVVRYAVVDIETTGISVGYRHRVAEVAVVHVDGGTVTDTWSTLINPERDLGPQAVHGIRGADARRAPRFGEAAGELIEQLRGRCVVAHNWPFDAMHLRAEFGRLGIATPFTFDAGLCTMQAAGRVLPAARRSLIECCAAAGLAEGRRWHTALDDARATADLLCFLLEHAGEAVTTGERHHAVARWRWPVLPPMAQGPVHRSAREVVRPHFLARLVDRVPRTGEPVPDTYLAMLDRALLDREISETEADALLGVAHQLGLHRTEVLEIHERYLRQLACAVWSDGFVSDEERRDMQAVAALLNLDRTLVDDLLAQPLMTTLTAAPFTAVEGLRLALGDRVVLTGTMRRGRAEITAEAEAAGLQMGRSVSRRTTVVVSADPDSMSGKAKDARAAGVPVVGEECFMAALESLRAEQ